MKQITKPLTVKGLQVQSTYSIYKRLGNLFVAIIGIIICINLWLLSSHHAQNWYENQVSQLGRSLTQQGALSLAAALAANDNEQLQQGLNNLHRDRYVSQATLYDKRGRLLASTSNDSSVVAQFQRAQDKPLVFIEEICFKGATIGYLRLYLLERQVMRYHNDYQQQLFEELQILMLLAALGGVLIARAFYKFRYRHHHKPATN